MKYVIYLRVSTENQRELGEDSGLGLKAQRESCMEYIRNHAPGEVLEFADQAISGTLSHFDRHELVKAIECLKPGDVFLVSKRDRLGRNVYHNIVAERAIQEKKATLVAVSQSMEGFDDGMLRLFKHVMDAFSEWEVYLIGMRTREALRRKKAAGYRIGRIPYGYTLGEAKKLIRDHKEQEVLNKILNLKSSGKSVRKIAESLNMEGTLTRDGGRWSHVSIHKIAQNAESHRAAYQ